jgi:hypothetical protein
MLEDALKSSSLPKDVGWHRSSRDANSMRSPPLPPGSFSPVTAASQPAPSFQSQTRSIDENEVQEGPDSPAGSDRDSAAAPSPAPTTQPDSRFFRFRFTGSGRSTPTQPLNSPPGASRALRGSHPTAGHLTSASLPSLVASRSANDELEELRGQLLEEKRKSEKMVREKTELESELENLSQALFEEVRDFSSLPGASSC